MLIRGSLVLLAFAVCPSAALSAQTPSTIARAAWLAGCWEARSATQVIQEMWMAPEGGLMIGGSRTVMGGAVREFEHLRIRAAGDTLIYTALPYRQQEASFRAVAPTDGILSFENPEHDFPQRIRYRMLTPDSLVARVEGPGPNGTTRGFDIPMRRIAC